MKKMFFLIVYIICNIAATAQKLKLNDGVTITLPIKAERLNRERALLHAKQKFDKDAIIGFAGDDNNHFVYKVDEILISLAVTDSVASHRSAFLPDLKRGLDEPGKLNPTYSSSIKTVNNNPIVIINYKVKNTEYYLFFCNNNAGTRSINGGLEFKSIDEEAAAVMLDQLLKSIKFKD